MKKRKAIIVVLAGIFLSGCGEGSLELEDTLPTVEYREELLEGEVKTIGVYVDATPSMDGFLAMPEGDEAAENYYLPCLSEINNELILSGYGNSEEDETGVEGGNNKKISYYRIDTPLWLVEDNVLSWAVNEEYYHKSDDIIPDDKKDNGKNRKIEEEEEEEEKKKNEEEEEEKDEYDSPSLSVTLKEAEKDDFSIIITDFYENFYNNGEGQEKLLKTLQDKAGIKNGKVFGLVGIRSAFLGTVYDIGPTGKSEKYGQDGKSYRPFYIIVWGQPQKVESFCNWLKNDFERKAGKCEYKVFYQEELKGLNFENPVECASFEGVWWNGNNWVTINKHSKAKIFTYIKRDRKENAEESRMWFYYSVPEELEEQFEQLSEEIGRLTEEQIGNNEKPKELVNLKCEIRETETAVYNDESIFEEQSGEYFTVEGVYYDKEESRLYVAITAGTKELSDGVWRLRWKAAYEPEADEVKWWDEWGDVDGSMNFERTENLEDYINALSKKEEPVNRVFLDGAVYFCVEE